MKYILNTKTEQKPGKKPGQGKNNNKMEKKQNKKKQEQVRNDNQRTKKNTDKSVEKTVSAKTNNNSGNGVTMKKGTPSVKIIPLGGIGEIGKNMTVIESGDDIILVDAGLMFPREEMLGVDYVIPDTTYLKKNANKLRAIFITHGHEDHIGALPYILRDFHVPVYSATLTVALIKTKLLEHPGVNANLHTVQAGDKINAGPFTVEFIRVSHSIDDSMGLAITTPVGVLVHTGDFKVDLTPINDKVIDLSRLAELGKRGVLALMSDSTNAERQGSTMSERQVGETFVNYFRQAKGRIIVASFASNVHRIQQVIDVAKLFRRKICLSGRSMLNVVGVTREIGYLNLDEEMLVSFDDLKTLKDHEVTILTTGSQGETMSGLVRMAMGQHPKVSIKEGDLVIISATPIPGNERYVSDVINMLYRKGAQVINDAMDMVHVSGHACREELKLMMSLVKPKFFIPVHGEYRHLYRHAEVAERMGIQKKNIFMPEIGSVIELNRRGGMQRDKVPAGSVLIDGSGVGDVGNVVLRDRQLLASDGMFIVVVTVSDKTKDMINPPDIVSRGFVYMKESEEMIEEAKQKVERVVYECLDAGTSDWTTLKDFIKKELSSYLYERTNRSPMILPIIIEV